MSRVPRGDRSELVARVAVGEGSKVAFVDLTTLALKYYATVDVPALFSSRTEIAHFNVQGATAISKLVADALKAGTTPATLIADFLK